jgi:hypothetical protein
VKVADFLEIFVADLGEHEVGNVIEDETDLPLGGHVLF